MSLAWSQRLHATPHVRSRQCLPVALHWRRLELSAFGSMFSDSFVPRIDSAGYTVDPIPMVGACVILLNPKVSNGHRLPATSATFKLASANNMESVDPFIEELCLKREMEASTR
jgi:hypothetical protein